MVQYDAVFSAQIAEAFHGKMKDSWQFSSVAMEVEREKKQSNLLGEDIRTKPCFK